MAVAESELLAPSMDQCCHKLTAPRGTATHSPGWTLNDATPACLSKPFPLGTAVMPQLPHGGAFGPSVHITPLSCTGVSDNGGQCKHQNGVDPS